MVSNLFKNRWAVLVLATVLLVISFFIPAVALASALVALLVGVWALSYHLSFGWLVLVFLSPLINWELNLSWLQPSFSQYPWLYSMHAPVVEFWTVLLLLAFGISLVRQWRRGHTPTLVWPGIQWFALFVGSALVSLINVPPEERVDSLKYVAHFLLLFYFGYLLLAANVVDTKKLWRQSLVTLASVGFLAALMGAISLVLGVWSGGGFHRAVPFAIFGWAPFGDQHIFLAEVITTTVPIFLFFWRQATDPQRKKQLAMAAWFVAIIGFLTLSRAGWVTMFAEAVLFFYLTRHENFWHEVWGVSRRGLVVVLPILLYFVYFLLTSPVVASSTSTRLSLTDMALFLFREHPLVGQGVGTFTNRVVEFKIYTTEFGEALDAQGVVQKLLAEQGLLGLGTFVLFVGWIVLTILRRYRSEDYTAEARGAYFVSLFLLASPLIFQLFNTQYYTSKMWIPIALALAQSILYKKDTQVVKLTLNLKQIKSIQTEI